MEPIAKIGEARGLDRFTVDFGRPLPDFDTVGALAFAATDLSEPDGKYYALIGQTEIPRREHVFEALMLQPANRILSPLFDDVMEIDAGKLRTVTVLALPGPRVLAKADGTERIGDPIIRRIIAPQLAEALSELKIRNITHRDIRWEKLFWRDDRRTQIVLGECFSAPPGYHHVAEAEVQGRCMALKAGRGEGAAACDILAMGHLILTLALGRVPDPDTGGALIAQKRADRGTANVLLTDVQIGASLASLARGMMADDPSGQWLPEQIKQWVGGTEPGLRPVNQLDQFLRPCNFSETAFGGRRALARAFATQVKAAASFVTTEPFAKFVQTGISDAALTERLRLLLGSGTGRSAGGEILLNRIRFALDPTQSLAIDQLEIMVDGIGPALAVAFATDDSAMFDAIDKGFVNGLFQVALEIDHQSATAIAERRGQIATITAYYKGDRGQKGLERVLYDLNPGFACQSPHVRDYCARTVKDLMIALDRAVVERKVKGNLFDRHVEGFIAARCGGSESRIELLARARGDALDEIIAQVRVLESLQSTRYNGLLRGLTKWMAEVIREPLQRLKNKKRRDSAVMRLDALSDSGSFVEMARGLDLAALKERDQKEYRNALISYLQNEASASTLRENVQPGHPKASEMGRKAVVVIAYTILGFSLFVNLLRVIL
jgi:hypothetical protein